MTNNLTPSDWVCLPRDATDEQAEAMAKAALEITNENDIDWRPEHGEKAVYQAAQRAAPPNPFIPVDKEEWERLNDTAAKLEALVRAWNALEWEVKEIGELDDPNLFAIIHNPEALIALHDAAVKAAGGKNECA